MSTHAHRYFRLPKKCERNGPLRLRSRRAQSPQLWLGYGEICLPTLKLPLYIRIWLLLVEPGDINDV